MRIRRILAAVIATAAFAGLGLTGAATATATAEQGAPSVVTPSECRQGGGTPDLTENRCKGGTYDGEQID
ncbi:hypothetical protein I2W78_11990 [Streptomyces spinoverrucosus]|uniref:hypothetical protein n=1 Tax=Streptomyces spinoverrucosus TaxID=284043 RepID=UPI0018C44468|nr:hypothetical protein [Streptomyces spinoverrucosus]MBG0852538.1 hypothetical protein [Streptomyces spinoverrucosus]